MVNTDVYPALVATGLPTQNDTTFCPLNQTSCYLWQTAGSSFSDVSSVCLARGGYLVSYAGGWQQPCTAALLFMVQQHE